MAISASSGPLIVFGEAPGGLDHNPDSGPSMFVSGVGLLNPATYNPGQAGTKLSAGWYGTSAITTIDYIPTTLGAALVYASQVPVSGVALTKPVANTTAATIGAVLGSATGLLLLEALRVSMTASVAGNVLTATAVTGTITIGTYLITGVTSAATVIGYGTGRGDTGTYIIDVAQTVGSTTITGAAGLLGLPLLTGGPGQYGVALYNPMAMVGRAVSITTAAGDVAVYTVRGYDIYGQAMSEDITSLVAGGLVAGKKAFKYIASVTPVGTVGATVTVGTLDVFGFPLLSSTFQDVAISWAGTAITASTGYLPGVTTTATATTGDVRGTYATQSASDASKRLVVKQTPAPQFIGLTGGLYGVTQA